MGWGLSRRRGGAKSLRFSRRDRATDELVFVSVSVRAEGCLTGGSRVSARERKKGEEGERGPVRGACWAAAGLSRVGWLGPFVPLFF